MSPAAESKPLAFLRRSGLGGGAVAAAGGLVAALAFPDSHLIDLLTAASIFAVYILSWVAFCGPAMEASFGHSFFVGSVAYMTALLHTRLGMAPLTCLLLAPPAGALLGLAMAALTYRHRGLYFSMATMALQLTLYRCLFLYSPLFGGEEGVFGIRTIVATRTGAFALTGGAAIVSYVLTRAYVGSRQCLLLSAIGHNERLAAAVGVPVGRSRALGLALSGGLAALGGALYVFTIGQANVELAGDRLSTRIVLLGTLGGQSPAGPAAAAIGAYVLDQYLSNSIQYTGVVMSLLLLLLVIVFPRGLVTRRPQWREPAKASNRRRREAQAASAAGASLQVEGVRRAFGGVKALDNVTFSLAPGSVTGIIGPNGAGKTTLLRVLAGEVTPDSGLVRRRGRELRGRVAARARDGIRKTFQTVESFGELTVREHLATAMTVHGTSFSTPDVEDVLREARLLGVLDEPVDRLPPATARLLDIAMAVAARPSLVLLDEPFAGVSGSDSDAVSNAVRRFKAAGASVIVVEHRLKELFALVDRVLVMRNGAVIADEPPSKVFENEAVLAAYGTEKAAMTL
jgi:branched-chain amino acid transport system permease protein